MWFLISFYKANVWLIFNFVTVWLKSKFADNTLPAAESIKQGEGQLYPNVSK